ncbi:MAG TPA: glycosyltransferase family 9 protein [Pirellulales bacterium]
MSWWSKSTELARQARLRQPRLSGPYRYVRLRWHLLFGLMDAIGYMLRAAWQCWFGQRPVAGEQPRSILLIQLDHLGDAVLTSAILPAIRKRYPAARLEVLAAPWNREVFEISGMTDAIHVCRVNRFARGWRPHWLLAQVWWGLRLRRRRFDLAIDVRGEMPLALIAWLAGAKRRVGWNCGGGGFLLTDSAEFVPGRPEMESRLALLQLMDVAPTAEVLDRQPWLTPPAAARAKIATRLASQARFSEDGLPSPSPNDWTAWEGHPPAHDDLSVASDSGPLIVVHLGAGTPAKRWPVAHWRELIGRLLVEFGPRLVLIGGKRESALAGEVLLHRTWPSVDDWTGRLTLSETAALIEQADLFIGADSGPAHLSAAVGTPAVVLFSGTNRPEQWRPWGRASVIKRQVDCSPCHLHRCPFAGHPCMTGISPERVVRHVAAALRGMGGSRVQGSGFERVQGSGFRVQESDVGLDHL